LKELLLQLERLSRALSDPSLAEDGLKGTLQKPEKCMKQNGVENHLSI
jgi:hypothetical protein